MDKRTQSFKRIGNTIGMIEEALERIVTDADSLEKLGTDTPNDLAKQAEIEARLDMAHAALNGQMPALYMVKTDFTAFYTVATSNGEAAQLILSSATGMDREELERLLTKADRFTIIEYSQVHQRHTLPGQDI